MRFISPLAVCAACILFAPSAGGALRPDEKDQIIQKNGAPIYCIIFHERRDKVEYKVDPIIPNMQTIEWGKVRELRYKGMEGDLYKAGFDEKTGGQYGIAAQRFEALAKGARIEWEQAYGLWQQGECYELSADYERAAQAFGGLASAIPTHRLALDALYRQGINLAQKKDEKGVQGVVDTLKKMGDEIRNPNSATSRTNAALAVLEAAKGNFVRAKELAIKVAFAKDREPETFLHWGTMWADFLRKQGAWPDAAEAYRKMLLSVGSDPVACVQIRLGLGQCLVKAGDAEEALIEFVRLDSQPFGSPSQRTEIHYWFGRLMWETAEKGMKGNKDQKEYAETKRGLARMYLRQSAQSASDSPYRAEAQSLLNGLPPDPNAKESDQPPPQAKTADAVPETGGM